LRENLKKLLWEVIEAQEDHDVVEMRMKEDQVVHIYLLYLVGVTLFIEFHRTRVVRIYLLYLVGIPEEFHRIGVDF